MKEEFNLSEKIKSAVINLNWRDGILVEDVKEFIKILKEHFTPKEKMFYNYQMFTPNEFNVFIDKLAGEKLI